MREPLTRVNGEETIELMAKTKTSPVIGKCRLCPKDAVELCDSHILPKWCWKRLRDPSESNPNPITVRDGKALQVSTQVTEYMLCRDCEDRFEVPENYVAKLAYTPEGDPLILHVLGVTSRGSASDPTISIPVGSLDTDKLVYFAASVFWRAAVAKTDGFEKLELGPYREELRRYLLGELPFPGRARVTLTVLDLQPKVGLVGLHNFMAFPMTDRLHGYRVHQFFICGLHFGLAIGNVLPSLWDAVCLHHGTDKIISLSTTDKFGMFHTGVADIRNATPKGKLSQRARR